MSRAPPLHSGLASISHLTSSLSPKYYIVGGIALAGALLLYDFSLFKRYGTSGAPSTLSGYVALRKWGLYLLTQRPNLLSTTALARTSKSYLQSHKVPQRTGKRPASTFWPLPQRQRVEPITPAAHAALHSLLLDFADNPPYAAYLESRPSRAEGGVGQAIYVRPDAVHINPAAHKMLYEVAHLHPSDNSLHVYLGPADARLVLERGWGQRFPASWLCPPSWMHVFAPRSEDEVEVVRELVRAAVCFAAGRGFEGMSGSWQ